ncbi:MAG: hypothetical protein ACKVOB_10340 [Sphingomonas sp.]
MMEQERANELLADLGSLIVGSQEVAGEAWSSLAVVAIRDGGWSVSGLLYVEGDDDATPFLPDEEFDDIIRDFYDATLVEGKPGWLSCLIQINRDGMQVRITFEYENADRWAMTPGNRAELIAALRG